MDSQSSQFVENLLPPVLLADMFNNKLVIIKEAGKTPGTQQKSGSMPSEIDMLAKKTPVPEMAFEPASNFVAEPAALAKINWLGDFNKQVLILVHDENNVHLGEADLNLLGKMLQALNLSFADIAVVNCCAQAVSWPSLSNELVAKKVIFFGVDPSSIQVPIRLPHFRVHNWNNSNLLYSPSLTTINTVAAEQSTLKKDLWKALQELFA